MKKMITLYADEGMVITNGEIFGSTLQLAEDISDEGFYEISKDEYEAILEEQQQKNEI